MARSMKLLEPLLVAGNAVTDSSAPDAVVVNGGGVEL